MDSPIPKDTVHDMERGRKTRLGLSRKKPHSNKFKKLRAGLRAFSGYQTPHAEKDYEVKQSGRGRILVLKKTCPRYVYQLAKHITTQKERNNNVR